MSSASVRVAIVSVLCGCAGLGGVARGQWTVTELNPSGTVIAQAQTTVGGRQAGSLRLGWTGATHACVWSGTAASIVDLNPAGASDSLINAMDENQQVGSAGTRAALWSGTAASYVDLSPAGTWRSEAWGVRGGRQVGYAAVNDVDHAGMWSQTAGSWVDLHPAGATRSYATAVDGDTQAGFVFGGPNGTWSFASLWRGTAASWVNLHPGGSAFISRINAIEGERQVGAAYFLTINSNFPLAAHASVWNGTAASWVDLHPAGAWSSEILAMHGEYLVGYTNLITPWVANPRPSHASLWNVAAGTWEDLSLALPTNETMTGWNESYATSVWSDGLTLYVSGYGVNQGTHAFLWTRPLCATADFDGDGDFGTDGDIQAFFACLAGDCCATCFGRGADFNGDGDVGTDADIESFFRVLAGGAC